MARGKKSYYKAKYKGVQYIAKQLNKHYPKRYSNYKNALPRAREIVAELKSNKTKVTWSRAVEIEKGLTKAIYGNRYSNVGRKKKVFDPRTLLGFELQNTAGIPYFNEVDYRAGIEATSEKVFFTCDFIENIIQGGTALEYRGVFSPMVRYLDLLRDKKYGEKNSDNIYYLKASTPILNKKSNKYFSQLFVVDSENNVVDIGIDPIDLDSIDVNPKKALESKGSGTSKKQEESLKTPETLSPEQQIESQKIKYNQSRIDLMIKLIDQGMNPSEAEKMVNRMFPL